MYDALTELSDLSRQLQKRERPLPTADRLLTREIRVFESMVSMPGPHMTTVHRALAEKSFKGVALRENGRLVQIHAGKFFRSMVENLRHRMTSTTSSHVSTRESPLHGREARDNQLIHDMKVLHRGSWPEEELDIQYGDTEVLRLCEVLKVDRRETVQGFREYKEIRASRTPAAMEPLLKAVRTIAVSTSECERAFSSMNYILTAKRNALSVSRLSSLVFIKCNGPPLGQFNPENDVRSWLEKGRRSAEERACPAPALDTAVPKAFWSLF
ncbi:E3 SUMO-protein ligase KIAA1586 [Dissostichus eleginoides]|uniref:E3 SUMO-protein ligase KIAA1586 n=1 Tax=Dissostichus eleginoides TaxID=100907 RepID=A0AAD9BBM8_DISEL|nr:E3 SUMO-protein ligase KIAA1586 [Dissostichus eleginoides]